MQQFYRFKRAHPGCILLFRIGDFYETFDDDAVTVSKALGLTLTKRTEGVPMAGVPFHQLETYLKRLVAMGYRVAVGDQIEDAAQAKGLVQRAVTRVATPGTIVEEALLDDDASVRVAAIAFCGAGDDPSGPATFAVAEASTGDFVVGFTSASGLVDELTRRRVREVIYAALGSVGDAEGASPRVKRVLDALGVPGSGRASWHFRHDEAREAVLSHFGVSTVVGFGLNDDDAELGPAGALIRYLKETQTPDVGDAAKPGFAPRGTLAHLRPPRRERVSASCILDAASLRALEVERVIRQGPAAMGPDRSLSGLFIGPGGGCRTSMGKRLIRDWLCRPSADAATIAGRHAAVSLLVEDTRVARELGEALDGVQDVARIAGRIALDRATPRDVVALGQSLSRLGRIAAPIENAPAFVREREELAALEPSLHELASRVASACIETPPAHLREGGLFRDGIDSTLDEARLLQRDAGAWLAAYQERLAGELNLPGIKVGFNKVFGYYIELTAAQAKGTIPAALERKQTLRNAERYTTAELRDFERRVTTAESRAVERERQLFAQLCDAARNRLREIQAFAELIAGIDALGGFAHRARARGWVRPEMTDEPTLFIDQGRHPVLEEILGADFVPNDLSMMNPDGASPASLALITGPNMAGKSTFIRQVALVVLLAHAGSFVPAKAARIGLTDRVFTRIGADDALHAGQSTFMVEMTETANILNNATPRSLVVLDEIGRGTSTLDGLSLAWAITEHLAACTSGGTARGPRCLFATHYHELTDLEETLAGRVMNLHVAVREWTTQDGHQEIVFLHRILPGRTDQSYGVHVAKLAGIPSGVVNRAREVLASLAVHHGPANARGPAKATKPRPPEPQMSLFREYVPHPAMNELRELKIESLTPLQAFDALRKLRELSDQIE